MNVSIKLDESRCLDCGTCSRECQRHIAVNRGTEEATTGLECLGCLHCYAVCPQEAISVDIGENTEAAEEWYQSDPLFEMLARRRSCRKFSDRQVEADLLRTLTRAAAYIPSGGNSLSHRLTVLTGGSTRRRLEGKLEDIYRKRRRLLGSVLLRAIGSLFANPQMRAFIRDRTYLRRVSYLIDRFAVGEDPIFYKAPVVIFVHPGQLIPTPREDGILAAYNIVMAAESMGLGSCFVSLAQNAINTSRTLKKMLGMVSREQVHAVVVIGYPAVRFRRAIPRGSVPVTRVE